MNEGIPTEPTGYAIYPKMDCPHLTHELATNIENYLSQLEKPLT
jgi:hypothetical protein